MIIDDADMGDPDSTAGLRFVVLHHVPGEDFGRTDEEHFDWMFQSGDALRTWASPVCRFSAGDLVLPCQSLPPHRVAYLDYEGPVSGNRGTVRRVLSGTFTVKEESRDSFVAMLLIAGDESARCTIELHDDTDTAWTLSLKNQAAPE